jgi:hypothetical protein
MKAGAEAQLCLFIERRQPVPPSLPHRRHLRQTVTVALFGTICGRSSLRQESAAFALEAVG